jgi:hypothetical protein
MPAAVNLLIGNALQTPALGSAENILIEHVIERFPPGLSMTWVYRQTPKNRERPRTSRRIVKHISAHRIERKGISVGLSRG